MDEQESDAIVGLLRDHFGSRAKVLEFGSGGSTVAFSPHASSWVAIEHDPDWGARTQAFLGEGSGVRIEVVLPNRPHRGQDAAIPGQFASYIEAGRRFCPEGGYDFVLVDGRARVECMLKLADWGLLRPGSIVALHDLRRERYLEHLDGLLRRYRLVSAVTKGCARGLGVFEYLPDERDEVATRTLAEPARGRTNGRLFVYGFPGLYGGAGTELHHQIIAWQAMGREVHLIPTNPGYRREPLYGEMLSRGVVVHAADEWEAIAPGDPVFGFCNAEYLANIDLIRSRSRRTVFVNCMTWLFDREKRCAAEGKIALYLYQNNEVREASMPVLRKLAPDSGARFLTFRPYFEASLFPFIGDRPDSRFGCGRISRQDTDKFARNTLTIYERFVSPKSKEGLFLGFDSRARRKIGEPPSWIRTAADHNVVSQGEFYRHCDIVLQPMDTTENWPRVGFEAMASGSVLVVDNRGGWRGMVEHGVTGWLCDRESDFIYYASKMAYEPAQREDMAATARERALGLGGLEASMQSWENVFKELETLPE